MSYKIYDISKRTEASLDLKNCTITGNSTAYTVKDGIITKYSIIDGEIDTTTSETVERIELTNYQLTLFDALKKRDGNESRLDNADLTDLTPDSLKNELNAIYKEKKIYNVATANVTDNKVELGVTDKSNIEKKIAIEFEKTEEPGFFKKAWNKVCNLFKGIGHIFSSMFGSDKKVENDEEVDVPEFTEEKETTPKENKYLEVTPPRTIVIKKSDEHNPITLCNDLGISYTTLKLVNPNLDLTKPLKNGTKLNLPEIKKVKPGSVTNVAEAAEAAGVSKEYVEDILFKIEGQNGIAAKVPYDDMKEKLDKNGNPVPIKGGGKRKNGTLTIGYGHTGRVFGKIMTRENKNTIKITQNQAYELLVADILLARADAEHYYGKAFNEAPQSIQDGIIDIIFNKGLEKGMGLQKFDNCREQTLTPQIKKKLESKDYAGCISKLIYETGLKGLQKRNYYRLITAMNDLNQSERKTAMKSIEPYYNEVCRLYQNNKAESDSIRKAWTNAQNGICYGFMS